MATEGGVLTKHQSCDGGGGWSPRTHNRSQLNFIPSDRLFMQQIGFMKCT
jgi:hypothetical protein